MLNTKRILYSLKDVAIMPATISEIEHRCECKTTYDDGMLPIFTAPMPCVVNLATYKTYKENKINPILPRTEDVELRKTMCHGTWCAFSLSEFTDIFLDNHADGDILKVLIDIANGNMLELYNVSKKAKEKYGHRIKLMIGNIANPETFRKFCEIGVDYVRLSVGSGQGCTTATNLGILYPMASLIDECFMIKETNNFDTKIIADGGISSYRRMIKALALGADYVMLGSALNKLEDSAGEIVEKVEVIRKKPEDGMFTIHRLGKVKYKEYYGMASEKGMKMLGKTGAPEGKIIYNKCDGTIETFINEFESYLRSAMSYCNIRTIDNFVGGPELNILSENASNQFNQTR